MAEQPAMPLHPGRRRLPATRLDLASGAKASPPKLDLALQLLREGDTLKVTRLDRLSRSVLHRVPLGADLRGHGIELHVIEQGTEYHARYAGNGVMIYWHVERKNVCIHSQLKSCSSSEVASMIEGLLRHCTDAENESQYVDTHGASVVGFAFTELLNFRPLPRLTNIGSIRLYRPDDTPPGWPALGASLTRPIRWEPIEQQYDQMVKYATALRLGTAEAEQVLRRFTRDGDPHLPRTSPPPG